MTVGIRFLRAFASTGPAPEQGDLMGGQSDAPRKSTKIPLSVAR